MRGTPQKHYFSQNKPNKLACNTTRSKFVPRKTVKQLSKKSIRQVNNNEPEVSCIPDKFLQLTDEQTAPLHNKHEAQDNNRILPKLTDIIILDRLEPYHRQRNSQSDHWQPNSQSNELNINMGIPYYKSYITKLNGEKEEIKNKSSRNYFEQIRISTEHNREIKELQEQYDKQKEKLNDRYKTQMKDNEQRANEYQSNLTIYDSSIDKYKKIINRSIGDRLIKLDPNILELVLDHHNSVNIIFLLLTNKFFNNLIKIEYNNYILLYNNNCTIQMIKIPKNIFIHNEITIEQILYVPLTKEGRTIIHLCARNNNISLLLCLHMMFPNLNVNVFTIDESWHPIHNAFHYNNYIICQILFNIGIDHDYCIDNEYKLSITDQMNRYREAYNINLLHTDFQVCTTKTQFKYKVLLEYPDIINILQTLYYIILDSNINSTLQIINL